MKIARSIVALLIFSIPFGCSTRIAGLTIVSTKNVYPKGIDISALSKQEGIEAKDVGFLGIGASLGDAIDKALERGHGNLMIDCVVYVWQAPLFIGFKVRGTVVNVPYTAANEDRGRVARGSAVRTVPAKENREQQKEQSAWSQLRRGLDQSDVIALIGEPTERSVSPASTIWFYPDINGGYVLFKSERVHSWKAP